MTTDTAPSPSTASVARELRAELARLDINGSELARRIGRPQQTVNRWIKTGRGLDLDALADISSATGISTLDLMRAAHFACSGTGRVIPGQRRARRPVRNVR